MDSQILAVLNKILVHSYEAYIVGGYPRDFLLQRDTIDIDICTNMPFFLLVTLFPNAQQTKYGSISFQENCYQFEITIYRKEIAYQNYRKPTTVLPVNTLEEDLSRRDFTINTICMDCQGNIIDLLGGITDLKHRIIRTVGSSNQKIREDALRILRALRFAVTLNFSLHEELKEAIIENRFLLNQLSGYRIKQELSWMFDFNPQLTCAFLKECQLLEVLHLENLEHLVMTKALGIWAQLPELPAFPFTKQELSAIRNLQSLLQIPITPWVLYGLQRDIIVLLSEMKGIDYVSLYEQLCIHSRKDVRFTTQQIINFYHGKTGPYIRIVWQKIEKAIIEGIIENTQEAIFIYLKQIEALEGRLV